ncbi:MAG: hypothetical protein AB7F40_08820 [Victivallaceae bacterium]
MKFAVLLPVAAAMLVCGCASEQDINCWPAFEYSCDCNGNREFNLASGVLTGYRHRDGRRSFDLLLGALFLSRSIDYSGHHETMWCTLFDLFHTASYADGYPGGTRCEGSSWRIFYGICANRTDTGVSRTRVLPFINVYRDAGCTETSLIWRRFMSVRSDAEGHSGYFAFIPW